MWQHACTCRLDEVDMDIVVFTNLTTEDMEESEQSLEEALEAQARLLRRLIGPHAPASHHQLGRCAHVLPSCRHVPPYC